MKFEDALATGDLIDVSDVAEEVGFGLPVAVTEAVYEEYIRAPFGIEGLHDEYSKLWDTLLFLKIAAQEAYKDEKTSLPFDAPFIMPIMGEPDLILIELKDVIWPQKTNRLNQGIIIMLPEEENLDPTRVCI